jgi:hypothetical protein
MSEGSMKSGPSAYSAGFLPAVYQGTVFRSGDNPILYLQNPPGINGDVQRDTLNFVDQIDHLHQAARPGDSTLEARIASYELAFRMQSSAPEAVDLSQESPVTTWANR